VEFRIKSLRFKLKQIQDEQNVIIKTISCLVYMSAHLPDFEQSETERTLYINVLDLQRKKLELRLDKFNWLVQGELQREIDVLEFRIIAEKKDLEGLGP